MKLWKSIGLYGLFFMLFFILISYKIVENNAREKLFSSIEKVPHNKVGLLLGTSKYVSHNHINLYYKYRIEATFRLFQAGKIDYILISGDNRRRSYNEPITMQKDLIKLGIPQERIILDYAGFRTLDSVVRCREVFGQDSFTIISQEFHNKRALFIAEYKNSKAIAYNAETVGTRYGLKTNIREIFARVKMSLDLLFGVQPKFLGDKIQIP